MGESYSEHFCQAHSAEAYDGLYQPGTADDMLWQIEKAILRRVIGALRADGGRIEYLDFACGTGRVIAFVEAYVDASQGIDVSPEMIRSAVRKVRQSGLACVDLTTSEGPPGRFDLITAFRFFLNAEPVLRTKVMKALASRLRDQQSRLVFNNHGNPWSYKAALWPFHRARQWMRGDQRRGNYLTHRELAELLSQAGLAIVERIGVGFLTPKLFRFAPRLGARAERGLANQPLLNPFGVNQVYVVRRADEHPADWTVS
jgi:SAM-dependent methyltransferase